MASMTTDCATTTATADAWLWHCTATASPPNLRDLRHLITDNTACPTTCRLYCQLSKSECALLQLLVESMQGAP